MLGRKLSLGLFLALGSASSFADQFYLLVELDCDRAQSELRVRFRGQWNEAGLDTSARKNVVDPRKLVTFGQGNGGEYVVRKRIEPTICTLGNHKYLLMTTPLMAPGFHPEVQCATRIGANHHQDSR